jgi:hypothetical protein
MSLQAILTPKKGADVELQQLLEKKEANLERRGRTNRNEKQYRPDPDWYFAAMHKVQSTSNVRPDPV